jgi:cytochrome oxidase assembly protein ShyY1
MLALHVLAIAATVGAVLLGGWQYGVWQSGREDQAASRVDARPVPLASVISADGAFPRTGVGKPVTFSGRWVPASTLYVADRELDGRSGVWAVSPVAVCPTADTARCATAPAMLVVRGWAPSVQDAPPPATGPVHVTGWLQPGEGSGDTDPDPNDDVIPQLRVADAIQHVDQDLYGAYVISKATGSTGPVDAAGLTPVTPAALPEASAFTSVRNLLYAVEWWFFGGFAVYVWARWCRDEVTRVTGVPSQV